MSSQVESEDSSTRSEDEGELEGNARERGLGFGGEMNE